MYVLIILLQTLILPLVSGGIQLLVAGGKPGRVVGGWGGVRATVTSLSFPKPVLECLYDVSMYFYAPLSLPSKPKIVLF